MPEPQTWDELERGSQTWDDLDAENDDWDALIAEAPGEETANAR